MESIPLTGEIQSVILAVQAYKRFWCCDAVARNTGEKDWYSAVRDYYFSLPLPPGLHKNNYDFESALEYPVMKTISTEVPDLSARFRFPR